ncbi:LuxR C-terminal-related transcriptional regulator [Variovorax sp. CAN2819]|uniref:LuxR C-terminal-related transcriptional regulator n=1 Tax=Variovorax sp. CAN15 TaxID=3046727 RepID=UPI00264A4DCC|nr:LuxR C-terminal-related transcriptional regulator [Variovorax sp. CAN15]MDN6887487.1 LuxR C-terminal-related transcriptional regulator [Variovorax sp. CAN15]
MQPAPIPGTPALRTRSRRLLVRQGLLERLDGPDSRRCVVLRAPAGFGKSSLLLTWQRELVSADAGIAWLRLAELPEGDLHFMTGLMTALAGIDTAIPGHALAHAVPDALSMERMVIALVRGIAAHGRRVVLIVDDVHCAQSGNVLHALQLLVEYAPSNLLCVFASQDELPMTLAHAPASKTVLELRNDDLRFSLPESIDYLGMRLPHLDERAAASIHRLTEGWPALLRLASADVRRRRGVQSPLVHGVADPEPFAAYFHAHVFPRLSETQLRLLTCCAATTRFSAPLCADLAGDGYTPALCAELLEPLVREGLLSLIPETPEAATQERWWHMHPLLRSVLLVRFADWPEAARLRVHATACHAFATRGMHHQAVRHALAANNHETAARLAERGAEALFTRGKMSEVIALLRQLDARTVADNANLGLWIGWVELADYRLDDCARSIERLRAMPGALDPTMRYRLTLLGCLLAIRNDDNDALSWLLPELLAPPPAADEFAMAGRRNVLTWLHLHRGEFEEARRIQRDEPAPRIDGEPVAGTLFGSLVGQCLVGLSYAVEGQMHRAERIYRQVLGEAQERGARCAEAARLTAQLLVEVLYEQQGPLVAARFMQEQLDTHNGLIPDTTLRMIIVANRAQQAAGRLGDALEHLAQAGDFLRRFGMDRALACVLLEQLGIHLANGDAGAARASLQEMEALHARHPGVGPGTLRRIADVVERARIRMAMHDGELPSALEKIERLSNHYEERGQVGLVASLQLQAAEVEHRLGRAQASRTRVCAALRLGHRLGLLQTLLCAHDNALPLILSAAAIPNLDPVLGFFIERIESLDRSQRNARAEPPPGPRLRDDQRLTKLLTLREAEIAELLLQSLPNKKIALTLGLSLDTVKWHLKNIYMKLDAHGRGAVAQRMRRELERDGGGSGK